MVSAFAQHACITIVIPKNINNFRTGSSGRSSVVLSRSFTAVNRSVNFLTAQMIVKIPHNVTNPPTIKYGGIMSKSRFKVEKNFSVKKYKKYYVKNFSVKKYKKYCVKNLLLKS